MKIKGLLVLAILPLLTACGSKINDNNVTSFQGLSQQQQTQYWQARKIQNLSAHLEHLGMEVYQIGDEFQIVIPASIIFIKDTPAYNSSAKTTFQAITDLLNTQSMPSIRIDGYADTGSKDRNYALSQSWAKTLEDKLRESGLNVGVIYTVPHGQCDNIGKSNLSNRLEIHYRISHDS